MEAAVPLPLVAIARPGDLPTARYTFYALSLIKENILH